MTAPWETFVGALPAHDKPTRDGPIRLVCFDMDGVLVQQESSWVAVHDHFGVDNEDSLHAFLRGEISDEEFIRRDIKLWKRKSPGITLDDVEGILTRRLALMRGAKITAQRLQRAGVACAIVSAGIEAAARRVAHDLKIPHVSANTLLVDARGRLTGEGQVNTPLRDKAVPVRRFAHQLGIPLSQVACVGNSSPDISMLRVAGLGIAFRPTDEFIRRHAQVVVEGPSLTGILPPILSLTGPPAPVRET